MNTQNSRQRLKKSNTSGYRGVYYSKQRSKWKAYIEIKGKRVHIGMFENAKDGAIAKDKYIKDNNLPHHLSHE